MIEEEIGKLEGEVTRLKSEVTILKWKATHLEEVVGLILKDLCLEVVASPSEIELKPAYENDDKELGGENGSHNKRSQVHQERRIDWQTH